MKFLFWFADGLSYSIQPKTYIVSCYFFMMDRSADSTADDSEAFQED